MIDQPVPNVSLKDIERVVRRDFGVNDPSEILGLLRSFATGARVQMAILKLANGDLEKLTEAGNAAIQDYRDVLSWAEYPRYMSEIGFSGVPNPLKEEVIESDWKQYNEWLLRA